MKLFTIPNLITLANLSCGCVAIVFAFNGNLVWSAYLVGIAAVLDFLDGFVARALKSFSPIGKDLDSLADMVTFGVVPGVVMFQLLRFSFSMFGDGIDGWGANKPDLLLYPIAFTAFLIPLFSALRLAKFNNDTRQADSFIGVPTPANSILVCSLPLAIIQCMGVPWGLGLDEVHENLVVLKNIGNRNSLTYLLWSNLQWILLIITVIMSYLLISELSLFSLKFKSLKWKGNELRYSFLAAAVVMIALLKFVALPLIIVLYIVLSIVNNLLGKKT